ncbi:hypothetical protein B0H17DRAFT_1146162 [Mycena rosella]|uniref:Uncharacterized protein n=1 Tax=Mycena rosella TaxID=1033263 RepID=A0AAD7CPM0_MYCRO|nr:hypothetical protein B0H17DRAFT_1146162 [Mycena rosella]
MHVTVKGMQEDIQEHKGWASAEEWQMTWRKRRESGGVVEEHRKTVDGPQAGPKRAGSAADGGQRTMREARVHTGKDPVQGSGVIFLRHGRAQAKPGRGGVSALGASVEYHRLQANEAEFEEGKQRRAQDTHQRGPYSKYRPPDPSNQLFKCGKHCARKAQCTVMRAIPGDWWVGDDSER